MAALAADAVFGEPADASSSPAAGGGADRVDAVTITQGSTASQPADQHHAELTDQLVQHRWITSPEVEAAFRALPREVFVPGVSVADAYRDDAANTKHDGAGTRPSTASVGSSVSASAKLGK
jgi:protein-L-isoaspartate(D-aspartate) O-methyltransferase